MQENKRLVVGEVLGATRGLAGRQKEQAHVAATRDVWRECLGLRAGCASGLNFRAALWTSDSEYGPEFRIRTLHG